MPHYQLAAIARKVTQLAALSARSVVYERHEIIDDQGDVLRRYLRGSPFVLSRDLGLVPVDSQSPHLDDGSSIRKDLRCYADGQGIWHRVTQYRRVPAPTKPSQPSAGERVDPQRIRLRKEQALALLRSLQSDPIPVAITVRDEEILPRVPARAITGLAYTQHGLADRLTLTRRRMLKEHRRKRRLWALPLCGWLRSISAIVEFQAASYRNVLYTRIAKRHLKALIEREDVVYVEPRRLREAPEDDLTETYLCKGTPARSNLNKDLKSCALKLFSPPIAYMDGLNAATGVLDYVNAGYDGMIDGGNSDWSVLRDSSTLSLAVRDGQVFAPHVAFTLDGSSRFLYFFSSVSSSGEVEVRDDIDAVADRTGDGHGTAVAAIAMSDVTDGQDPELTTSDLQVARSGIARRVAALASIGDVTIPYMLEKVGEGFASTKDCLDCGGVDVVVSSVSANSSGESIGGYECPTEDEARGLDDTSLTLVEHFVSESILFFKSAGNIGNYGASTVCTSVSEVSAPGASPAVLSVGGLDGPFLTPNEMQECTTLNAHTSGSRTLDGRTYPSLLVLSYQCGVASIGKAYRADATEFAYTGFGGTSACAPRLAGAALLFKHWALEYFGADGRDPGITLVNLLNFADGYVEEDNSGSGVRASPPSPWWGLGRFRMRLISQEGLARKAGWGTHSFCLEDGEIEVISICEPGGRLPYSLRHLRITAWWLEVNTDAGEAKANISMSLVWVTSSSGLEFGVDTVETEVEQVLRLQYDRYDSTFPCPPGLTAASIVIWGKEIPPDTPGRSPHRGTCREVFVSWLWEGGDEDPSEIVCSEDTPRTSVCGTHVGSTVSYRGLGIGAGVLPDSPTAMRRALDASMRSKLSIATHITGNGGAFPVGEEVTLS